MPFVDPEDTLAGAIIVASVTFLAVYTALYPLVLGWFLDKPELEKSKQGFGYWQFFTAFIIAAFLLVIAAMVATLALLLGLEEDLVIATGLFMAGFILGAATLLTHLVLVRKSFEPYARESIRRETHKKEFPKALLPKLKPSMTVEDVKRAVDAADAEASKKAERAVKDSGFAEKKD